MEISAKQLKRMNNKLIQFFRFIVLNLKILKAVDRSKRSWVTFYSEFIPIYTRVYFYFKLIELSLILD